MITNCVHRRSEIPLGYLLERRIQSPVSIYGFSACYFILTFARLFALTPPLSLYVVTRRYARTNTVPINFTFCV